MIDIVEMFFDIQNHLDAIRYPGGGLVNNRIVAHDDAKGSFEQLRRSAVTSLVLFRTK